MRKAPTQGPSSEARPRDPKGEGHLGKEEAGCESLQPRPAAAPVSPVKEAGRLRGRQNPGKGIQTPVF